MKQKRTIIIGDVHGCARELEKLVHRLDIDPHRDRVIFIGDLINKGPDSRGAFDVYKQLRAQCLMGNHEFALLKHVDGEWNWSRNALRLQKEFGRHFDELIDTIRTWPGYIETEGLLAVHAGVRPDLPVSETPMADLVNIRTWDGVGTDLQNPHNPPWFEFYQDPRLVVFGHWASLEGVRRDNVIGLDTGCVYGKTLSALVLPEQEIVSVNAKMAYCAIRKK